MRFFATRGKLRISWSTQPAFKCSKSAPPPGRGDDKERICTFNQEIIIDVIAINNPLFTSQQTTLFLKKLRLWDPNPIGIPKMQIKMDKRQTSLCREQPGECALTSASHTGDNNTATDNGWRVTHALNTREN